MRPIIKYSGGKERELERLLPLVPQFAGKYVEPFLGGGAMLFRLRPQRALAGDINERLMHFYLDVRERFAETERDLRELAEMYEKDGKALYYKMRDAYNGKAETPYRFAAVYYLVNRACYRGLARTNAKGEFNVPFGYYKRLDTSRLTREHAALLKRTRLVCQDYAQTLGECQEDDFAFLDPPYDCTFTNYGNGKDFGRKEQERLAGVFRRLPCKALMVINNTPLTERLYIDFIRGEYGKKYPIGAGLGCRTEATHLIIANYECKTLI